jgi:hypothetical protein
MRHNAKKFGLMLMALMLALLLVGTAVLAPCLVSAEDGGDSWLTKDLSVIRIEDSGGGKLCVPSYSLPPIEGYILFEQPPTAPDDPGWTYASYWSDNWYPVLGMDDFWGLTEDISDVHWYGMSLTVPYYEDCDPTGMEFEIIFYEDDSGSPGAPVATFSNVTPTVNYCYLWADIYSVYRFDVAKLKTPVSLTKGWVSIQGIGSPNDCHFAWLNSPTGNTNAILDGSPITGGENFAFTLTGAPPPNVKYLHSRGGLFNLTDPIGTQWHELWPVFCREYHLSSWNDTGGDGILSHCDRIDMYEKPDGEVKWYHVEDVTITLNVTPGRDKKLGFGFNGLPPPMFIELEGGYNASVLINPVGTQWHEIYPVFCVTYNLTDWTDNGSKELDYCDYIWLRNKHTGEETEWHVEEVAVDIVVTMEPPPVGGEAYPVNKASLLAPWIAVGVVLAGGAIWYVLRRRRAQS